MLERKILTFEHFRATIAREFPDYDFGSAAEDRAIADLRLDSLDALEFTLFFERQFGVELPMNIIADPRMTLQVLYDGYLQWQTSL